MKKEIRGRVKRFLTSEAGRIGMRAPLALGVASGTLLLSQMVYTVPAEATCKSDVDCGPNEWCYMECEVYINGTCDEWASKCVSDS